MTSMHRFTAYRRELSQLGKHNEVTSNPDDQPQFEGVVFTDGTCVIKWLTAAKSTSVFSSLKELLSVHGHPEYGTDIVWHDLPAPPEHWARLCYLEASKMAKSLRNNGVDVRVVVEHDDLGHVTAVGLRSHAHGIERFLMPYSGQRRIVVAPVNEAEDVTKDPELPDTNEA